MAGKPFAPKMIVFGRMGERIEAPENTLRAYRYAIDNGFPIAFDLYMTKDGELIATHDTNLKAKAGIDKHPTNCCWKGELENVDLGAWKNGSWMGNWKGKGIRYPRIDEILDILPAGRRNQFQLRDPRPEACRILRAAVDRHPNVKEEDIIFLSNGETEHRLFPKATFWLECMACEGTWDDRDRGLNPVPARKRIAEARACGATAISVYWDPTVVTREYIEECNKAGFQVHVWPINDPKQAMEALRRGAASVTTDSAPYLYASMCGYAAAKGLKFSVKNIQGHRGDAELAPENTMPAYLAAAKGGFSIELDLYLTRDGEVFCTHDQRIGRKDSGIPMWTWATNTYWKGMLDRADAGAWMGEKWRGTKYPRLDDVLPLVRDYDIMLNLEIKDPRVDQIMPKVMEIMRRHPYATPNNVIFSGSCAAWISQNMASYRYQPGLLLRKGWLADDKPLDVLRLIDWCGKRGFAYFGPRWDHLLVTEEAVAAAHAKGMKVCVWAVDDAGLALEALRRGVDYVMSNRPNGIYAEMCAARDGEQPPDVPGWPGELVRRGTGEDDRRWYSGPVPVEPNATYAFSFEMKSTGGGGAAVTGVDVVNVGLSGPMAEWTPQKYVFRTLADRKTERVHFGQWHVNGTVSFRRPRLERVKAVHSKTAGFELGTGEQIEGSTYHFTSAMAGFWRNDSRVLASARKVSFNSTRWCMSGGSEVTYRHALPGRRLLGASFRVGCCYRTVGQVVVEVSANGADWAQVGAITNVSEYAFNAPASLFPAQELQVRLRGESNAFLQIHSYTFDAPIDGEVMWASGNTRYISEKTGKDVGGSVLSPYFDDSYGEMLVGDGAVKLWRASSGRKVPPNRSLPSARAESLEVRTAANEAEAVQLVVSPTMDLADVKAAMAGDLASPSGGRIPASAVDILRVSYVQVDQMTDTAGTRGLWPDPLPPQDGVPLAVAAKVNQPFWVRVKPPRGTPKGTYRGMVEVVCVGKAGSVCRFSVPLAVEVFGFDLPDRMTCETAFGANMWYPWRYHAAKTPAERKKIADRYLKALADSHLSPYNPVPGVRWRVKWRDGEPTFDWAEWDAAIGKAIAERHINAFRIKVDGLGSGTFHSRTEPSFQGVPGTNAAYHVLMGKYLKGIESHLREKGWLDMAYVYWFDEPDTKDYPFVMNGFKTLKRHAPGLRRMLTEQIEPALFGGPNIWCPHSAELDPARAAGRRDAGDTIWWYVCCSPKAPYAGEFIDHPSNEMRMWLWQTWGEQVTGVLIWESLYWHSPEAYPDALQNPYRDPMSWLTSYGTPKGVRRPWGNGDGRLFYPPVALAGGAAKAFTDGEPVASFRSEGLRDGLEDYEYFAMLKRLDPSNPLLKVPESVYRTMTDFSVDPSSMEAHRIKLAREIERIKSK